MTGEWSAFVARELSAWFASCSGGGSAADKRVWEVFVLKFEEATERYRKRRLATEEGASFLARRAVISAGCWCSMRQE